MLNNIKSAGTFIHRTSKPYLTGRMLRKIALAFVLFVLPLVVFAELADEVQDKEVIGFDAGLQGFAHGLSSPWLDATMKVVTDFGDVVAIVGVTVVLLVYLLRTHRRRMATVLLFGVGGAAAINLILKFFFTRARPELWTHLVVEDSYSFPSGHAMASSALAFSIMAILWSTKWRWYAVVGGLAYMTLIGFSRIYLGVHYPSDILAGWCISLAWVLIVKTIIDRYPRKSVQTS